MSDNNSLPENQDENEKIDPEQFIRELETELPVESLKKGILNKNKTKSEKFAEKLKIEAKDTIRKCKGYFLFHINENGNLDTNFEAHKLNEAEYRGLISFIKTEIAAIEVAEYGDKYKYVDPDPLDDDDDDDDDEKPNTDSF